MILAFFVIGWSASLAGAQDVPQVHGTNPQDQPQPQQDRKNDMPGMDMKGMNMPGMNMDMSQPAPDWMPSPHDGSGTGWQPAATPEHMWMKSVAAWDVMAHGVVFADYNQQGGPRGAGKAESVNWLMLMEQHKLGRGSIMFREMFSAESLTAPLSHHLQDSTHTSFGVITTGLDVDRFRIEGSVFNGREPDEKRYGIQFAPLDSWSARLSVAASRNWTAQYSYGRLERPEALEPGSQRRQTASVEYVRPFASGSWATSVVWGRVHKVLENRNLNSYLLETTANFRLRNYAFSRMELVDKDELFPGNPLLPSFRIGAYTFGGAHDLVQRRLWQLALGADATFYSKASTLDSAYGKNPVSFQVFLRVRPALSHHEH